MYRFMLFLEFGEFGPLFLPIVFLHTLLPSLIYFGDAHYECVGMFDSIPTDLWGSVIFFFILFSFCFLERILSWLSSASLPTAFSVSYSNLLLNPSNGPFYFSYSTCQFQNCHLSYHYGFYFFYLISLRRHCFPTFNSLSLAYFSSLNILEIITPSLWLVVLDLDFLTDSF